MGRRRNIANKIGKSEDAGERHLDSLRRVSAEAYCALSVAVPMRDRASFGVGYVLVRSMPRDQAECLARSLHGEWRPKRKSRRSTPRPFQGA